MKRNSFDFFLMMKEMEDYEYILALIAHHCGPAIEGVKISSLLNLKNTSKRKLCDVWNRRKSDILSFFDIKAVSLKRGSDFEIILLYHEDLLINQLKNPIHMKFLKRFGYEENWDYSSCLSFLKERYEKLCPHEIGIFLGYPISDVVQFICCPNKECRFVGYWKVYSDEENAKELFRKFDQAKEVSCKRTIEKIFPKIKRKKSIHSFCNVLNE